MTLKIARGLSLPIDTVTKTVGVLAQRRKGKTYTASVMAEEFVAAQVPFVVLDPTGAWWGLRASADGKRNGLPVVILGGQHGDVPLERTAGKFVAELVVDHPGWYVIDFSLFESNEAERQFATDFAERLYRRKGQPNSNFPMHLFIDEADRFIPQQSPRGDQRMLGAFEAIVRRGGLRGLGTTLISQRAAVVNKNVLEQLDVLIVLRTVGPNDQDAIKRYVDAHGTDAEKNALLKSLASLKLGEAWVWEPGSDPSLFQRVQIRERKTFNSSETPKAGVKATEPTQLAPVDLEVVKEGMAATIERVEADDPKKLRKKIGDLERELRRAKGQVAQVPVEVRVPVEIEVPVLDESLVIRLEKALDPLTGLMAEIQERLTWDTTMTEKAVEMRRKLREPVVVGQTWSDAIHDRYEEKSTKSQGRKVPTGRTDGDSKLGKAERSILTVLQTHGRRTHAQIALQTGYSAKASTIGVALSKLRKLGYVTQGQPVEITPEGQEGLGSFEPLPEGQGLLNYWLNALGKAERVCLEVMVRVYPNEVNKYALAEATGYSSEASTIGVAMSKLRRLELATGWKASDDFMAAIGGN